MKLDSTQKWLVPALIIVGLLLWMFLPWQCSQAQTAGEFSITFQYSAGVDKAMQRQHGTDWIPIIKERLKEAWKNHKSESLELLKRSLSEVFEETQDVTKAEAAKIEAIIDSVKARKERRVLAASEAEKAP